jgi:hypothetical protein
MKCGKEVEVERSPDLWRGLQPEVGRETEGECYEYRMSNKEPQNVEGFTSTFNIDALVKSQKLYLFVIPAKAGIQCFQELLDSRLRGSDGIWDFLRDRQYSLFDILRFKK